MSDPPATPPSLPDQVAIITGAGAGLGRAYALDLARAGFGGLLLNDGNRAAATAVAAEIAKLFPRTKTATNASLIGADEGTANRIVEDCISQLGKNPTVLVNNAGVLRDVTFAKQSKQQWDDIFAIHVTGTRNLCKAVWPIFRQQKYGRIVNVSSISGVQGFFGQTNYSAAKSGIIGLSKALAKEGAKTNISVFALVPHALTAMTETIGLQHVAPKASPDLVAPMVTFLCHPETESSKLTGRVFEAGPGWYCEMRWRRTRGVYLPVGGGGGDVTWRDIGSKFAELTEWGGGSDVIEDEAEMPPKPLKFASGQAKL